MTIEAEHDGKTRTRSALFNVAATAAPEPGSPDSITRRNTAHPRASGFQQARAVYSLACEHDVFARAGFGQAQEQRGKLHPVKLGTLILRS